MISRGQISGDPWESKLKGFREKGNILVLGLGAGLMVG